MLRTQLFFINKVRSPRGVPFFGTTRDSMAVIGFAIPPDQNLSHNASTLLFKIGSVNMIIFSFYFLLKLNKPIILVILFTLDGGFELWASEY